MHTAALLSAPSAQHVNATGAVKKLNQKAMLVKLSTSRPRLTVRNRGAEDWAREQMGNATLVLNARLFSRATDPVRVLINDSAHIYAYHIRNTIPHVDRGPRLLPVDRYDDYKTEMRRLVNDIESATAKVMPDYDRYVAEDIAYINSLPPKPGARAFVAALEDYEDAATFAAKLKFHFQFTPLPDAGHFLFDMDEEDKASVDAALDEALAGVRRHLGELMHTPLVHLVGKLSKSIGSDGAIFRDSAVENVVEQCEIVESLAMGDEQVLEMVRELRRAIRPVALTPHVVRESPVERSAAAVRLQAVADKMSCLFGG